MKKFYYRYYKRSIRNISGIISKNLNSTLIFLCYKSIKFVRYHHVITLIQTLPIIIFNIDFYKYHGQYRLQYAAYSPALGQNVLNWKQSSH